MRRVRASAARGVRPGVCAPASGAPRRSLPSQILDPLHDLCRRLDRRNCRLGSRARRRRHARCRPCLPPLGRPPPLRSPPGIVGTIATRLRLTRRFTKRSGPRVRVNPFAVQTGVLFPISGGTGGIDVFIRQGRAHRDVRWGCRSGVDSGRRAVAGAAGAGESGRSSTSSGKNSRRCATTMPRGSRRSKRSWRR